MDEFALHSLSCRFSAGRYTRHKEINDVMHCAHMWLVFFYKLSLWNSISDMVNSPIGLPSSLSLVADRSLGTTPSLKRVLFHLPYNQYLSQKIIERKIGKYSHYKNLRRPSILPLFQMMHHSICPFLINYY